MTIPTDPNADISIPDESGVMPGLPDPEGYEALAGMAEETAEPPSPIWRQPDFAWLWAAHSISELGTHISALALPLIAATALAASAFEVGLLAALGWLPFLLVGLVAGVWADRMRRRPILVAADLGRAGLFLLIPLASALGVLGMPVLYAVALLAGTLTVFFVVANQAYLPTVVERAQLMEANGKIQATASAAQIVGPAIGGLLIRVLGAPLAVAVDAVSFLASAACLGRIRRPEPMPEPHPDVRGFRAETAEGFRMIRSSDTLRALALSSATVQLGGYVFLAVYVLFMTRDLGLGAGEIGLVLSTGGLGALAGAVAAGPLSRRIGQGPAAVLTLFLFGATGLLVPLAVLVPAWALPMVVASEFLQWMAIVAHEVSVVSLRQAIVPDRVAGRVNGTFRFLTQGLRPIASLLGGILGGTALGLAGTLVASELVMLVAFLWLLFSPVRTMREPVPIPDPLAAA